MTDPRIIAAGVIGLLLLGVAGWWYGRDAGTQPVANDGKDAHGCLTAEGYAWCDARSECIKPGEKSCTAEIPNTVMFLCKDANTILANFYPSDTVVDLELSDQRKLVLAHATSASGARYANADESFVFWNKGDTAVITERSGTSTRETFSNCSLMQK